MGDVESVLRESWRRLVSGYVSGKIILRTEKDMENAFVQMCRNVVAERGLLLEIGRQKRHRRRLVDVALSGMGRLLLLQLKLYHDKADWKESPSMINTVESDLKFAKGYEDTYVAIIDTIPSTSRVKLPFKLKWESIEIDGRVFKKLYLTINPQTSPLSFPKNISYVIVDCLWLS